MLAFIKSITNLISLLYPKLVMLQMKKKRERNRYIELQMKIRRRLSSREKIQIKKYIIKEMMRLL